VEVTERSKVGARCGESSAAQAAIRVATLQRDLPDLFALPNATTQDQFKRIVPRRIATLAARLSA